jgi:signal transduction histidine kinase
MAVAFDEMLDALEAALGEAQASEQRTRRFLAEAAHQLRTPIAGIHASVDALPAARTPEERDQLLAGIARESARAGRRVASLLRMARLERHGEPARRPTDVAALCREEVSRAASLAPSLEVSFGDPGPVEERAEEVDPDDVREALANLLDNARRHALSRIQVDLSRRNGVVEIAVSDDGPGLPATDLDHSFEPFVTLDGHGGSGLGLPIARRIAQNHGGDLTYEGGTFRLRLAAGGHRDWR